MGQVKRNTFASKLKGGKMYGTSTVSRNIWSAVENGEVEYVTHVLQEGERLDIIAGEFYDDGRNWWIIAAASGIGWGLQVPPGTTLRIPTNLQEIKKIGG